MPHQVSLSKLVRVVFGLFVLIMMVNSVDARSHHHWYRRHHHFHGYYGGKTSSGSSNTLTSSATLGSVVAVLCYMTLQYLL
ncbi:hypothetical protein M0R45_001240 [Rubus argutus]|uniref:Uncharacterized protein n=1 Tax=Rubus argutus TaxID=59490 RepID=A0AAW1VHP7_RUBAR